MRASTHPHVVRLYDVFEDARYYHVVLEYLEGKDLFTYVEGRTIDEGHVKLLTRQLTEGLEYLHTQLGVMHRDIKMENILV